MADLIRPFQRALTGISPHQGNAATLVPNLTGNYSNVWTVAINNGQKGYEIIPAYGAMTPDKVRGEDITKLYVTSAGVLTVEFTGDLYGTNAINLGIRAIGNFKLGRTAIGEYQRSGEAPLFGALVAGRKYLVRFLDGGP